MNSKRPQAQRVSKPVARYRPGKAPNLPPGAADPYDSDESEHAAAPPEPEPEQVTRVSQVPAAQPASSAAQGDEEDDSSEYETDTGSEMDPEPEPFKPMFRAKGTAVESKPALERVPSSAIPAVVPAAVPAASAESSSEYDTESEESEEEPAPPKPIFRPSFVSKAQRKTLEVEEEDAEAKAEAERVKRKQEAHDLAAARVKASLLEAEAAQRAEQVDLSDTDGRDPEAEFQAWRERELKRLARAREAEQAQKERETELARRARLTQAERDAEDLERARQTRKEKMASRTAVGFMQKYRHKGAFFQDMNILHRDVGPTENEIDKSSLPQILQVRDFGRKGRSKWTHLAAEDTTRQQSDLRFRPRRDDPHSSSGRDGPTPAPTGANSFSQRPTRTWGQTAARSRSPEAAGPDEARKTADKPKKPSNRLRLKEDDRPRRKAGEFDLDDDRAPLPERREGLDYGSSHGERGPSRTDDRADRYRESYHDRGDRKRRRTDYGDD